MNNRTPTLEAVNQAKAVADFKFLAACLLEDDYGISSGKKDELLAMGKATGYGLIGDFLELDATLGRWVSADNAALIKYVGL